MTKPLFAFLAPEGAQTPGKHPCKAAATPVQEPCTPAETPLSAPACGPTPGSWDQSSEAERTRALMRLAAVERSQALFASGLARAEADAKAAEEAGVSTSSVSGWRRRAKGADASTRAVALLDGARSGRPSQAWSSDGAQILWTHFLTDYLRLERPEATAVWRRTARIAGAKGWTMPPLAAFVRRLKREVSVPERVRGRDGAVATMDLAPHQTRTVAGLGPLSIINGDGKEHDVQVVLPSGRIGRPHVWYWQDVWSRKILAWAAGETENARIIQVSLHEVIVTHGVPGKVVIDNTRAAGSKALTGGKNRKRNRAVDPAAELPGTLSLLGIACSTTTVDRDAAGRGVGRGRAKPIERAFGDLCTKIDTDPRLAGAYTGRSPQDRPETHRSRAASWETFLAVVGACVAEHNARAGRASEAAAGRSLDAAFAEGMAGAVVRRLGTDQARLLLMTAERVRIARDGTFRVSADKAPGRARNRYHDPVLVERSGETLVARYDPERLHDPVLVHDGDGRYVVRAACLMPVGFDSTVAAKDYGRARRRTEKAARTALEARRDMDALLSDMGQAGAVSPAPVAPPAAIRLVTGKGLPEMPPEAQSLPAPDKGDLLRRIEARRVEFEISHADICLLAKNALGKQVVSLKSLSVASLEALIDLLDNGVFWTEPVEASEATPCQERRENPPKASEATPCQEGGKATVCEPVADPTPEPHKRGFMAALKHVQQLNDGGASLALEEEDF